MCQTLEKQRLFSENYEKIILSNGENTFSGRCFRVILIRLKVDWNHKCDHAQTVSMTELLQNKTDKIFPFITIVAPTQHSFSRSGGVIVDFDQHKSLVLSNELIKVELPPWKI